MEISIPGHAQNPTGHASEQTVSAATTLGGELNLDYPDRGSCQAAILQLQATQTDREALKERDTQHHSNYLSEAHFYSSVSKAPVR